jgi:ribosome-associated protein
MVMITDQLEIDDGELTFTASRSAGPGGQNVNKVNTRITLRFDLEATEALSEEEKERIRERLATRISKAGVLSVSAQRERTQAANRKAATERFAELLQDALDESPERRPTKVPRRSKRRRLENKRRRGQLKRERSRSYPAEPPE